MNAFQACPDHKFAFGLQAIVHLGPRPVEEVTPAPIEPWEFVYQLGDAGVWGVGFRDDDLVPFGAAVAERDDILDKFTKALDSTGIVVSMARTNLAGHTVFGHGAFTSADRDVRRYAIQKAMRAIDLGAELGAQIHDLPRGRGGVESCAARPPRDALDRYREAVNFLCGYVLEQRYPTRFALPAQLHERPGEPSGWTIGHALAFITTLDHPEMVGLDAALAGAADAGIGGHHTLAQAVDAGKLFHVDWTTTTHAIGHHDHEPGFSSASVSDSFFLVKQLAESGYGGPLHFDVDPQHVDNSDGIWDFVVGCTRTYRALAAKAKRFADDPEIRDALAECGAFELAEQSVGPFSAEAGRALSAECFDPHAMAQRRYPNQRLDQLVSDLVLGLR